jgi:hypothetical protein
MSPNRVLVPGRPQFVKFFERAQNNEEECSNRDQQHEVEQQRGITSRPVVWRVTSVPKYLPAAKCLQ